MKRHAGDYGAWLLPDGQLIPVRELYGHIDVLKAIFWKAEIKKHATYDNAMKLGYVRVLYHPLTLQMYEATQAQKSKMMDIVFDNAERLLNLEIKHRLHVLKKNEEMDEVEDLIRTASSKTAVSSLPNDVFEEVDGEEYPQEYMSPSPGGMGSVRPGDDPILTGSYKLPDAEAIPTPDQLPQPKKRDTVSRMISAAVQQELVRRAMTMKSRRTL